MLGVTLTQGEAKLWLQTERQQDSHAASLLFSLFCLKAFSLLYMVALALVCIFGGTWTLLYVWAYGCMDVWMYGATRTLFVFLGLFHALC